MLKYEIEFIYNDILEIKDITVCSKTTGNYINSYFNISRKRTGWESQTSDTTIENCEFYKKLIESIIL